MTMSPPRRQPVRFELGRLGGATAPTGHLTRTGTHCELVITWQRPGNPPGRLATTADLQQLRMILAALSAALPTDSAGAVHTLTGREAEVATLVGRGRTNSEIAAELFVTAKTVEYHLRRVYLKLDIANRRQLRDLVQSGQVRLSGAKAAPHPHHAA